MSQSHKVTKKWRSRHIHGEKPFPKLFPNFPKHFPKMPPFFPNSFPKVFPKAENGIRCSFLLYLCSVKIKTIRKYRTINGADKDGTKKRKKHEKKTDSKAAKHTRCTDRLVNAEHKVRSDISVFLLGGEVNWKKIAIFVEKYKWLLLWEIMHGKLLNLPN